MASIYNAKRKRGGKMRKKGAKGAPKHLNFGKTSKTNSEEKIMTKLCPRGKAAAKRKFKVYPSVHTRMHTLLKFVRVKLKIHLV